MKNWLCFFAFIAILLFAVYILYCHGFVECRRMRAVLFLFRARGKKDTVSLDSCTGWVQHVGRFCESSTYVFTLDAQLSKGDAAVFLPGRNKQQLLQLNRQCPSGSIRLDGKTRYYIRWEFRDATGMCSLRW